MKSPLALSLLLLACLAAPSCQWQQQQQHKSEESKAQKGDEEPPLHLGAVHQVYPEQGFALLRIIGPIPKAGTTLITHPADGSNSRIGNLAVSSQQPSRDGIIAADIRSGTIVKGDRVFQYRDVSKHPGKEQTVTDAPTSEDPLEQKPALENDTTVETAPVLPGTETASPDAGVDTTVLPSSSTSAGAPTDAAAPASPSAPSAPTQAPDYLNDIPENINDWN